MNNGHSIPSHLGLPLKRNYKKSLNSLLFHNHSKGENL